MNVPFFVVASLATLFFATAPRAQTAEPEAGLVALHQACLDAATDFVVLNIAAHPDDESSRTNAILRRKYGMRVVTAYSTYGDGGQNAIGREIGPELAGLRVRETLRAAAMSGVEVRWLGMPDFGFSKSLDETLRVWGADRLKDAMRELVARVDPDIVVTNHSLTQGHGHHRASFWAIEEVLKERAAKGEHVPPLYSRCAADKAQLTLDPSELDPARGETFARLAHRAWTQHVTQGPWGPHNPLQVGKDWWRVVYPEGVTDAAAADLMHWARGERGGAGLPADASRLPPDVLRQATKEALERTRQELAGTIAALEAPGAKRRAGILHTRKKELERVLLVLAGVRAEVWLEADEVSVGGQGKAFVVVHGVEKVQNLSVSCDGVAAEPAEATVRTTPFDGMLAPPPPAPTNGAGPEAKPMTYPGRFVVAFPCEPDPVVLPEGPEPRFAEIVIGFELDGTRIDLLPTLPYTPMPRIELRWDRDVLLVPKGRPVERLLSVSVKNHQRRDVQALVRLAMGPGIHAVSVPGRLVLSKEHDEARILVRATIDPDDLTADAGLEVGFGDDRARLRVQTVDVSVPPGLRIALVRGPEDSTERTLADLGIAFTPLDRDALVTARLEDFTTLLLDIRAYHHRPELAEVRERILQYCRTGGRVVAMYHKPGEWNERAGHPLLAPFPMTIGDERSTEEDSVVRFLQPEHRLLQHPHTIGTGDFDGWVQERGLNFPKTWDPAWTPLFEMKDAADEKPHQGALLHTQYGRGDFVYCSLALYRQLRTGNPGASRLLVNLLAK
jgi:LmbE family N-acetylglucosaminyl deacetylase